MINTRKRNFKNISKGYLSSYDDNLCSDYKKRCLEKKSDNGSDSESDYDDVRNDKRNFFSFMTKEEKVYRRKNDIFFNCEVTNENVKKLEKLISEVVEEYKEFCEEINNKNKYLVSVEKIEPKPIMLHITSVGGSLFHGFRAVDIIQSCPVPIHTIIEGYAISAASLMAVVGKKRYIHKNSYMLIHQLSSHNEGGKYEELVDNFTNNKELMNHIVNIYKENSKMNKRDISNALKHDLYWSSETCIQKGLCDEIYLTSQL